MILTNDKHEPTAIIRRRSIHEDDPDVEEALCNLADQADLPLFLVDELPRGIRAQAGTVNAKNILGFWCVNYPGIDLTKFCKYIRERIQDDAL